MPYPQNKHYQAGYDTAHKFVGAKGRPIIPDTGTTVDAFLKQFPEYYSSSSYPHTRKEFNESLSLFRKGLKAGVKASRRSNPSLPKGKFIPCKAVKINSNGSVSVRL
jgi:hypothetical protein